MNANRIGYRGYVTSRPFGGLHIPVPVQALVLRDYCARNNYLYKLHANENVFPNSYMVLEGMINELDRYEGEHGKTAGSIMPVARDMLCELMGALDSGQRDGLYEALGVLEAASRQFRGAGVAFVGFFLQTFEADSLQVPRQFGLQV